MFPSSWRSPAACAATDPNIRTTETPASPRSQKRPARPGCPSGQLCLARVSSISCSLGLREWDHVRMDRDDPEKRIAELERQLAEQRAAGDPGANRGSQQGAFPPSPQAAFPPPPQPGSAGLGGPHNLGDSFGMLVNDESTASRQFVASSAGLALWRKFGITVSSDGLTVDRRPGDVYSLVDAQLGPWVIQGVALHLQCGRHLFWLGGRDRRVGPATRLDAQPVHSVDAWLSESDFDELLFSMGGRWSRARGPAPGEPTRCLLFPNGGFDPKDGAVCIPQKRTTDAIPLATATVH
jgi:hypothetical protein